MKTALTSDFKSGDARKDLKEPNRFFSIDANVTPEIAKEIVNGILNVNRYDDEMQKYIIPFDRKPIEIIVNSYGGDMYEGFAIAGAIDSSITPVHTVCYGKAMSMGLLVYIAGHKRFAHSLATFMYHEGIGNAGGSASEMEETTTKLRRLVKKYDKFILDRTKLPKKLLDKHKSTKKDLYLFVDEAVKHGIVHEVFKSRVIRVTKDNQKGKNKHEFI